MTNTTVLIRQWREAWHRILDAELGTDDSGQEPPIPDDSMCDFRMHFDTWQLSNQGLSACFAIIPEGELLLQRIITFNQRQDTEQPNALSKDEAWNTLSVGIERLSTFVELSFKPSSTPRLISGNHTKFLEAFTSADMATIDLDDEWAEFRTETGNAVDTFLHETLYRYRSDYLPARWIAWGLCLDPDNIDPYTPFIDLYLQGYIAGVDNEGVFLFKQD